MTRRRAVLLSLLVAGAALGTGCSSGDDGKAEPMPSTAEPAPSPSLAPGLAGAGGTAYVVGIPTEPAFAPGKDETRDNGTAIRRWQLELSPGGPACTIVASEQPGYRGDFPDAVLQVFDTLAEEQDRVVANEQVAPPPGAVGAVRQELEFPVKLADGSTKPARLYQRQLLTPGKTLVGVTVAGPEDALDRCRARDVVDSLQLTGAEATGGPGAGPTSTAPVSS